MKNVFSHPIVNKQHKTITLQGNHMCKPKRDGGRRCAIHLHISGAAIKIATKRSGLTRYQVERLFAELTREAQGSNNPRGLPKRVLENRLTQAAHASNISEEILLDLEKSQTHDRELDSKTTYAIQTIVERSIERSLNLERHFGQIANETGLTTAEIQHTYETTRDKFFKIRGAATPAEYTPTSRARAARRNLPYDMASVVALEKLNQLRTETKRRVTLQPVPIPNSTLKQYGYHEGRLELIYKNGESYSYKNVPENVWETIKNSQKPIRTINRLIAGKKEYQYADVTEDKKDSILYRCASCGQFATTQHFCPQRAQREEISRNVPPEQVAETLKTGVSTENSNTPSTPQIALPEFPSISLADNVADPSKNPPTPPGFDVMFNSQLAEKFVPRLPNTISEQQNPKGRTDLVVWSSENQDVPARSLYIGSEIREYLIFRLRRTAPQIAEMIEKGKENNIDYIVTSDEPYQIIASYDSRYFTAQRRRGHIKIHRYFNLVDTKRYSRGEAYEYIEHMETKFNELVESGKAVRISPRQSLTKIATDNVYRTDTGESISLGKRTDIKKAIQDNKAFIVPLVWHLPKTVAGGIMTDDNELNVVPEYDRTKISGNVLVRKGVNGQIEVLTSERTLKCSCLKYRQTYYCSHIRYVNTHVPVAIAKDVMLPMGNNQDESNKHKIKLLGARLMRRPDVSLVQNKDGSEYIDFKFEPGTTNSIFKSELQDHINIPVPVRVATEEEVSAFVDVTEVSTLISRIERPKRLAEMKEALKRADTNIPFKIHYAPIHVDRIGININEYVSGSVMFEKRNTPDDPLKIKSHTLKCPCPEYAEKYDCKHIRFFISQPNFLLGEPHMVRSVHGHVVAFTRLNAAAVAREERIRLTMENYSVDRAQAALIMADEDAERIRREQEAREESIRRAAREAEERAQRLETQYRKIEKNNEHVKLITKKYQDEMMRKWETADSPMSPEQFYNIARETQSERKKGRPVLPYKTENVTDGMAAPIEGARRFGVELEFDFPEDITPEARKTALTKIGAALHEKGLTERPTQAHYHSGAANNWEKWTFENDATVSGEIVSPIMADTVETWSAIKEVCDILRDNGAIATTRTGSHVHVSTASYGGSTAKHAQLLRDTNADSDIIYRLASNPFRGSHRGTRWCKPNVDDTHGDIPETVIQGHRVLAPLARNNHSDSVNFGGSSNANYEKNHVEFRQWDGTLDESVIQTQILLSLAMVDKAEKTVIENKGTKPLEEKVTRTQKTRADNKTSEQLKHMTVDSFMEDNAPALTFINSLFRRNEERERVATLFSMTRWVSSIFI